MQHNKLIDERWRHDRLKLRGKLIALLIAAVLLIALFVFYQLGTNIEYVLPRRLKKMIAIAITGGAIAFATMIFQTVTNNRILTPSIIGLDSLYLLLQTFIVFVFGSTTLTMMNVHVHFVLTVGLMVLFSLLLYKLLFQRSGRNLYFLLLAGIVFGTFFDSLSTFMQVLIDPNEYMIVQDRMFASFNNVKTELLWVAVIAIAAVTLYCWPLFKYFDVLALGKDQAVNLGVPYERIVRKLLIVIAILISIATALVGPITFLGLLVANLAHEMMKTYRHTYLIAGSILTSIVALVAGQFIVEKVFTFSTTISVIINFIGGVYFLYLLLRENRT